MNKYPLMCKLFGHSITRVYDRALNPKIMKYVFRQVWYCKRKNCPHRYQIDTPEGDFNPGLGINLWGSMGICGGCSKKDECPYSSVSKVNLDKMNVLSTIYYSKTLEAVPGTLTQNAFDGGSITPLQYYAGFMYEHCPIQAFEPLNKDHYNNALSQWGDTLVT